MIDPMSVISHWYFLATLAGGFLIVGVLFIRATSHRVEIGVPQPVAPRTVQMQSAAEYAGQLEEMNKEAEEAPEKPTQKAPIEGDLGSVFADAIKEKVRSTVLEADVSLAINAPIKVEGGELKVDIPDGEVGQIVMKAKKQEVVSTP